MKQSNIGKGLASLIPPKKSKLSALKEVFGKGKIPQRELSLEDKGVPASKDLSGKESIFYIDIEKIRPNPYQPREDFNEEELKELADSIREHGILQPLIVTKVEKETKRGQEVGYQLVAGERRLKAAKMVNLPQVPAIIRKVDEQDKLAIALVENLQRYDLNSIEEAQAFRALIDEFNFSQKEIAVKVGKSPEAIANTLRLLDLPLEIQKGILKNEITEGHGRAILILKNPEKQLALFREILNGKLSVRQAEEVARRASEKLTKEGKKEFKKDPYLRDIEERLEEFLGTRVVLARRGGKGKITIAFYSQEELNGIVDKICSA